MRSMTNTMAAQDGYFGTGPVLPELRLMPGSLSLTRLLTTPRMAALRPAALGALRFGMGAAVGAAFGAVSGHIVLWIAAGIGLGAALNRVRAPLVGK